MNEMPSFKRILLKLSGETLRGTQPFGIDQEACLEIARSIKDLHESGYEVAIVIGGGNIFRGINLRASGIERTPADHMGMLATLINGIALQQALALLSCPAKVMSALECPKVAESYSWEKALEFLAAKQVLIFVGGTGNPYFTTDTAAALRASEIQADILLKATKVDGIYNKDPLKYSDAVKYPTMSYSQVLAENLQVIDATAIALCRSSRIPVFVFNMDALRKGQLIDLMTHHQNGTLVTDD